MNRNRHIRALGLFLLAATIIVVAGNVADAATIGTAVTCERVPIDVELRNPKTTPGVPLTVTVADVDTSDRPDGTTVTVAFTNNESVHPTNRADVTVDGTTVDADWRYEDGTDTTSGPWPTGDRLTVTLTVPGVSSVADVLLCFETPPTPEPTPTPTPTLPPPTPCPDGSEPPCPTPTPTATPTPEPTPTTTPSPAPSPEPSTEPPASPSPSPTPSSEPPAEPSPQPTPDPAVPITRMPDTGTHPVAALITAAVLIIVGSLIGRALRRSRQITYGEDD